MRSPRRKRALMLLASIVLVIALLSVALWAPRGPTFEAGSHGTMEVNDSGQSHGGFEYAGTYDALLDFYVEGWGELTVSLGTGLGDPVQRHTLIIRSWSYGIDNLTLVSNEWTMVLVRNPNGTGSMDYYVAEWSPSSGGEGLGQIKPSWFGLPDTYYLMLTLGYVSVA